MVCGHCCESGDLLSPAPGEPETLSERLLCGAAPGDVCVVEGSGAYCSGMCTKNYNSFPEAPEVPAPPSAPLPPWWSCTAAAVAASSHGSPWRRF